MARKRWTEPGDLNRCSFRSRRVVCSQAPIMLSRESDRAERCRIGSQPVGHNPARREAVLLKQFHHEFLCDLCIPSTIEVAARHLSVGTSPVSA
jgi:hypothetical protein